MTPITVAGLTVDADLYNFLVIEVLPGTAIEPEAFFGGLADTVRSLGPRRRELLRVRDELQSAIDGWHEEHGGVGDPVAYRGFLEEIGYLSPAAADFEIGTADVDDELANICGPQLVVPITNARYALNAVNARWGSLYDALYGTDALGDAPPSGPYDPERGQRVVGWVRSFLDEMVPLRHGSHADCTGYEVRSGELVANLDAGRPPVGLREPAAFAGHGGDPEDPSAVLLSHHGLGIELRFDREHPVGARDEAGVADVILESAVTVIADFEDSVTCVDATDKVGAYRNWLGLTTGTLSALVEKDGSSFVRRVNEDRAYTGPDRRTQTLRARALLLARVVGLLMTTPAVLDGDGEEIPEGILDAFVVSAIGVHDRDRSANERNSRHGSIYMVMPKLHGPDEVRFACDVLASAERTLGLEADTLKVGIMDEERRTTVNLQACIRAAASRVVFINTGFLDRTGDEIHTSMGAGPMVRKADMKEAVWIRAYEDWNVDTGLRCGFAGRAQIGKGMWAMPDRMADMLEQKIAHPLAGASCAWVPSPTAATLHATHYHRVDVASRQRALGDQVRATLDELLVVPVASSASWTVDERRQEVDNNVQSILGYAVRWVDQGIGCSTVPDIEDVGLMEDRATCRISSQHVANWLLHGIVSPELVEESLRRMAEVVDAQNATDPAYRPMAPDYDGPAFRAAHELVFAGTRSPSGYTEPILHAHRLERKRLHSEARA